MDNNTFCKRIVEGDYHGEGLEIPMLIDGYTADLKDRFTVEDLRDCLDSILSEHPTLADTPILFNVEMDPFYSDTVRDIDIYATDDMVRVVMS